MPLVATKSSASHLCNDGALDPPGRSRRLWIQKLKNEIICHLTLMSRHLDTTDFMSVVYQFRPTAAPLLLFYARSAKGSGVIRP
jgi:hypothetical protein